MLGSCGFCGFEPQIIDELITLVNKAEDPPAAGLAAAQGAHGLNKMMRMKILLCSYSPDNPWRRSAKVEKAECKRLSIMS